MIKSELPHNRTYFCNVILTTDLSLTSSEIIAYITAILGMVGDQTSTRLSLILPNVCESNPRARAMIYAQSMSCRSVRRSCERMIAPL